MKLFRYTAQNPTKGQLEVCTYVKIGGVGMLKFADGTTIKYWGSGARKFKQRDFVGEEKKREN